MEDKELLHELLKLQQESNANDGRIETKIENISTRVQNIEKHSEKQDLQIEKLTQIISDQKHLTKSFESICGRLDNHESRIAAMENRSAKFALSTWKKIITIAFTVILTSAVGYILGKIGIK